MRGGGEGRQQKIGLAVTGETGEADDLALARHKIPIAGLSFGAHANNDRSFAARSSRSRTLRPLSFGLDAAHGADQLRPVEIARDVDHDHLAVAHDHDAVARREHLAQDMRDQHAACARSHRLAHIDE